MRGITVTGLCLLVSTLVTGATVSAQSAGTAASEPPKAGLQQDWGYPPAAVTRHSAVIAGESVDYIATADTLPIRDAEGVPAAEMFFLSYDGGGHPDPAKRPILFSFNGGPGSASVWMHLGLLGPRRVLFDDEGFQLAPPYQLVNNEYSVLDVTDLVFIDPVSTGYSRALPGVDPKQFHGFREDLDSVAEFIRVYLSRHRRWDSPKYLIGESYGSRRAAGLSSLLATRHGIDLNGVVLVSAGSLGRDYGNAGILEFALSLPHMAATAWYHERLAADLQAQPLRAVLDEVEAFALEEYTVILAKGNTIAGRERAAAAQKLARYTGLPETYLQNAHLRVTTERFRKELLRDQNRTVGRLDSRYRGVDSDAAGELYEYDPAMANIRGTFTATMNSYLQNELGYEVDLEYRVSANVRPWKPAPDLDLLEELRSAMAQNPYLRVLVADGYYDKLYYWPEYTFSQFDFTTELRDRVRIARYEAGHMMYVRKASLAKMRDDLVEFIAGSSLETTTTSGR